MYPNRRHCLVAAFAVALTATLCFAQVSEKKASYLTIRVPASLGTYPMAINDSRAVTGYYLVSSTTARAFVQDSDGTITTFSIPDSLWTEPESINAAGDITGFFELVAGVPQGFLRYANGRIVTFNPPIAEVLNSPQAFPVAINEFDEVAGNYPAPVVASAGFTRSRAGGFDGFSYAEGASYATVVTGLNASGTVVGFYYAGSRADASFLLHPDGDLIKFVVPVEAGFICNEESISSSINADGVIAGWYWGLSSPSAEAPIFACTTTFAGGFVRSPQGEFTLFQAPGPIVTSPLPSEEFVSTGAPFSAPNRLQINQQGTISGSYTDVNQAQHGFVREPDGVTSSFDPPRGMQTTATGINDSGVITGWFYYDWNSQTPIGFLRIPTP